MFKRSISAVLALCPVAAAHDTWVETNTNVIRSGDAVHVQLKLGNHGNDHRDFKLAGKVDPAECTLEVISPDGSRYDLRDRLKDVGYTPTEGYWTAKFAGVRPGVYLVASMSDKVVQYAPKRSVKSAKTCFVVAESLDRVPEENPGFERVLGHPFELVPIVNPVTPMGPGQPIEVRLLYKDEPLASAKVSFIPQGANLKAGFDPDYERTTDSDGRASFSPKTGTIYLIVAHHEEPSESGEGFDSTKYSATLTVFVPELCPCCRN